MKDMIKIRCRRTGTSPVRSLRAIIIDYDFIHLKRHTKFSNHLLIGVSLWWDFMYQKWNGIMNALTLLKMVGSFWSWFFEFESNYSTLIWPSFDLFSVKTWRLELNKPLEPEIGKKMLRTCYKYRTVALEEYFEKVFKDEIDEKKISELVSKISRPKERFRVWD